MDRRRSVQYLGVDLAWGEGSYAKPANRSGVVALNSGGRIVDAGWTVGLDETVRWIEGQSGDDALLFVDAPLVVENETASAQPSNRSDSATASGGSQQTRPTGTRRDRPASTSESVLRGSVGGTTTAAVAPDPRDAC
jgi:predicted RNase H-like nuclease